MLPWVTRGEERGNSMITKRARKRDKCIICGEPILPNERSGNVYQVGKTLQVDPAHYSCIKKEILRKKKTREKYKRFRADVKKGLRKVTVTFSKHTLGELSDLSERFKTERGYKLPRTYIIRAMVEECLGLRINSRGIRTEEDLRERLKSAIREKRLA